jgi:hypothetical protein
MSFDISKYIYPDTNQGRQPQQITPIDWDNPLTKGLVGSYTPIDNGITVGGVSSIVGNIVGDIGNQGQAWKGTYQASNNYILIPKTDAFAYTNQVTFEALIKVNAFQTAIFPYISGIIGQYQSNTTGSPDYYGPFLRFNNTAALGDAARLVFGVMQGGAGSGVYAINPTDLVVNTLYHLLGTYDGSAVKLYVNGVLVASTVYSGAIDNDPNTFISLLADYTASTESYFHNRCLNGDIFLARIYNTGKTDAEAKALADNPWGIYKTRSLWVGLSGSTINLIIANLTQSSSLGTPALVQQNILSIANASQSSSLQNLSLVQASTLVVNNILSGQSLEVLVLIQQNTLVINGITEASLVVNLTLVQQNLLTIAGILSSDTLDTLILVQQNILAINSLLESNSIGTLTLVQQNLLVLNNLLNSSVLDNVVLTGQGSLGVSSLTAASSLGLIALVQANLLVIQNNLQSSTLAILDLVQHNVLTVGSLLASQTLNSILLSLQTVLQISNIGQTAALSSLVLLQNNILTILGITEATSLINLSLTQQNLLTINNISSSELLENLHLISGIIDLILEGKIIYVVESNSFIYVTEENRSPTTFILQS